MSWKREKDFLSIMRQEVSKKLNAKNVRFVKKPRGEHLLEVTLKDSKKFSFEVGVKLSDLRVEDFNEVLEAIKKYQEDEQK